MATSRFSGPGLQPCVLHTHMRSTKVAARAGFEPDSETSPDHQVTDSQAILSPETLRNPLTVPGA